MAEKEGKKTSKSAPQKADSKSRSAKSDDLINSNTEKNLPDKPLEEPSNEPTETLANKNDGSPSATSDISQETSKDTLSNSSPSGKEYSEKVTKDSGSGVIEKVASEGKKGVEQEKIAGVGNHNKNITPSTTPSSIPLTRIHLIDGEKGGVGKSFFARVLMHYLSTNKIQNFVLVDADNTNPDVHEVYNGRRINFSENEFKAYAADQIIELAIEQSVIVNLPAQVYPIVKDWIIDNGLVTLGQQPEANIQFVKWFICTGASDSVKLFEESLNDFGHEITHVLVRNYSFTPDWSKVSITVVNKDKSWKPVYQINFPKLSPLERDTIIRNRLTFAEALESKEIKILGRQRLRNFLNEVADEIDSVKELLNTNFQKSQDPFDGVKNLFQSSSGTNPSSNITPSPNPDEV